MAEDADHAFAQAGVLPPGELAGALQRRFDAAIERLCGGRSAAEQDQLRATAAQGVAFMRERWACARQGL
eukprot:4727211-Lingulodinium_polyedra.AAC.1